MTVGEPLRVLEESPQPDIPEMGSRRRWPLLAVVAALLGLLVWLPSAVADPQVPSLEAIEPQAAAPALNAQLATVDTANAAVEVAQTLIEAVNGADSGRVIELLAPLAGSSGYGTAQWPTLHGEIGWWDKTAPDRRLDEQRVTDFVRYFRTMPGSVVASSCVPDAEGPSAVDVVVVVCEYTAFGGIRGLMGDRHRAELGRLTLVVRDDLVVNVRDESPINELAWNQLGLWVARTDPDLFDELFREPGGWTFRPQYSGETAVRHAEAAASFAAAIGAEPLPFG